MLSFPACQRIRWFRKTSLASSSLSYNEKVRVIKGLLMLENSANDSQRTLEHLWWAKYTLLKRSWHKNVWQQHIPGYFHFFREMNIAVGSNSNIVARASVSRSTLASTISVQLQVLLPLFLLPLPLLPEATVHRVLGLSSNHAHHFCIKSFSFFWLFSKFSFRARLFEKK